jgi:Inner membrane protein YgaP-like, transmembrane domain
MKRNMGTVDRVLRAFLVGPLMIVLSVWVFGVASVLGILALVIAGIMFSTSAVGYCPAYVPFRISTRHGVSTARHTGIAPQH